MLLIFIVQLYSTHKRIFNVITTNRIEYKKNNQYQVIKRNLNRLVVPLKDVNISKINCNNANTSILKVFVIFHILIHDQKQ